MQLLTQLLQESARIHQHVCPRQVLGVRMGLAAGQCLNLPVPQSDKRLLTIVETDGCVIDGLVAATGCQVGRRTMRVLDYGKVAATFVDTQSGCAVRIVPSTGARQRARDYAPEAQSRWEAYLLGYQRMPESELLNIQAVTLAVSLEKILSKDGYRVNCERCGEEIINEREVFQADLRLCRPCAEGTYYQPLVLMVTPDPVNPNLPAEAAPTPPQTGVGARSAPKFGSTEIINLERII